MLTGAIAATVPQMSVAQSVAVSGDTTGAPTWRRPFSLTGLSTIVSATPFNAIQIDITDAAAFVAEVTAAGVEFDTFLHLYAGNFDPTDQFTNLVAFNDDVDGVTINAKIAGSAATGQHTVVISGFRNDDFGTYTITLNGAIIGWGLGTQEQVEELRSAVVQLGR